MYNALDRGSIKKNSRIALSSALAVAIVLALAAISLSTPQPAAAAVSQAAHSFPRLSEWWGRAPLAENAKRDYYVMWNDDPMRPDTAAMATMRAANPNLILLTCSSAAELDYSSTDNATFDAQRIGAIPTSWLLLQVGTTLSAPVTSTTATTFQVADSSKFRVNDLAVVDDEKCVVTAVGSGTITVKRGYAGSANATHASGARIAACVSGWANAATLNMTANCPLGRATGTFATPGTGTERAADWLARRTAGIASSADWDGILIDVCLPNYASGFVGSEACRTIADATVPTNEADYAAFDKSWGAGIEAYLASVRSLTTGKLVMTNGAPPVYGSTNGTCFEGFPTASTDSMQWHSTVVGPTRDGRGGSYLDWSAKAPTTNLTTMYTMGTINDYRMMRFGLTSALMGDGYFSYKTSGPSIDFSQWWYDEYDNAGAGRGYLGKPVSAATAQVPALTTSDLTGGYGAFNDTNSLNAWTLYARSGNVATKSLDNGAAKIAITQSAGLDWGIQFSRPNIAVTAGKSYTLSFRIKADRNMSMRTVLQQAASPYAVHAVTEEIGVGTEWQTVELPLVPSATNSADSLIFNIGTSTGTLWIDDLKLQEGDRNVYRRDFEHGIALVNATAAPVTVNLNGSFRKIKGTQCPSVNDGSLVTAVTIPAKDGIVLLRETTVAANTAPVAAGDSYNTANATALTVAAPGLLANDTDADGNALTCSVDIAPANGTVSVGSNGSFTYTPAASFTGVDTFTYRVYDGKAYSNAATVSITVAAPTTVVTPPTTTVTPPTTTVTTPTVKRRKTRTYTVSGTVRVAAASTAVSAAAAEQVSSPVLVEVRIERKVGKGWKVHKRVRVASAGSVYRANAKLAKGTYRVRAAASTGSVLQAVSGTSRAFKVR